MYSYYYEKTWRGVLNKSNCINDQWNGSSHIFTETSKSIMSYFLNVSKGKPFFIHLKPILNHFVKQAQKIKYIFLNLIFLSIVMCFFFRIKLFFFLYLDIGVPEQVRRPAVGHGDHPSVRVRTRRVHVQQPAPATLRGVSGVRCQRRLLRPGERPPRPLHTVHGPLAAQRHERRARDAARNQCRVGPA